MLWGNPKYERLPPTINELSSSMNKKDDYVSNAYANSKNNDDD